MNAPIIVTALFTAADAALLDGLRTRHFPPERNHLSAHLTLFHHLLPSLENELRASLTHETLGVVAPSARLSGVMDLGGGTALRVRSPALTALRIRLADAFDAVLTPQDRAGWRPHVTIQNKVARDDARALQATIGADYDDRPLGIAGLAAWWYRGGPWEPLARFRFAG